MINKTESKNPHISVIISAFSLKRFSATVDCIDSVLNNIYENFEIIVVIDGNEKLKHKIESKYKEVDKVSIIGDKEDGGPSVARNRGVRFARGKIVAFIDDDAFAPTDWLEHIARNFLYHPEIMAMGGKLLPVYEDGSKKLPEELLWIVGCTYKGHPENKQFLRNVISANMAVKKDVFDEIGFETTFNKKNKILIFPLKQLEDTIFCIRLNNKKSDSVLYDPDTVIYHKVPKERLTLKYILKRTFSEGMLKARIGQINNTNFFNNEIFYLERNYSNILLISTAEFFFKLKVKNGLLLSLVALSVALGYLSESRLRIYEDSNKM